MKINLNDYFIVRLTRAGEEAWAKQWEFARPKGIPDSIKKSATLPDGRVKFQIWDAMHTFGPASYLGAEPPFEGCEIEVVKA
jgi:hypothetical protein